MSNIRSQIGVTLMELVVTLAILGILAAIGTPVLMGNIEAARNSQAKNTLNSIYLSQKNYSTDNNYCYFVGAGGTDEASLINQNLFYSNNPSQGPIEPFGSKNSFKFYVINISSPSNSICPNGYRAYAESANAKFCIDHNNSTTGC